MKTNHYLFKNKKEINKSQKNSFAVLEDSKSKHHKISLWIFIH